MSAAATLLERWLEDRLSAERWAWFDERLGALARANSDRERDLLLGLVPRRLGRTELALDAGDLADADAARPGWDPSEWTVETAARTLVLCRLAERDPNGFGEVFRDLSRGADLAESLTLLRAVPLLPGSPALDVQVAEGLRTNMRAVFEAIAHRNPVPRERFDENRWNHMVLKALFIDSTLAPIQGLDERANAELARILGDYAHERWAAGRPVTPELWRPVGPFATGTAVRRPRARRRERRTRRAGRRAARREREPRSAGERAARRASRCRDTPRRRYPDVVDPDRIGSARSLPTRSSRT